MPHKHKRKGLNDRSQFDLPPSVKAKPLPVRKSNVPDQDRSSNKRKKSQDGYGTDDTPRAFARLMHFKSSGKGPKGLDNGELPKSKRRKIAQEEQTDTVNSEAQPTPKILPGERLSEFAQRVNQALPLSGLAKNRKHVEGVKERMTKHEKKLRRLQEGWRKEEARIREKEEEERELAEEEKDEEEAMWEDKTVDLPVSGKKGKKGRRKKVVGEVDDGDDDPWEALRAKREERKGINDVVQAPPTFTKLPKEKFKIKNGAKVQVMDVPNTAGSLRRREELGEARQGIIESYRKLMEERRKPF